MIEEEQLPISNELITVEERVKWEATQNLSTSTKIIHSAADTFTPGQIKFLSRPGRKNMGIYGVCAILFLLIIVGINLWGLIKSGEDRPLVLVNLLIPSVIFIMSIEKLIASLLYSFVKSFK